MGCEKFSDKGECLKAIFDKGIKAGAKFFEIYEIDILNLPKAIEYGAKEILAPPDAAVTFSAELE